MCKQNCCGFVWAFFLSILMLTALSAPWYFNIDNMNVSTDTENCTRTFLTGWRTQYCSTTGKMCSSEKFKKLVCPTGTDWRTECDNGNESCAQREYVYDVAGVMTGLSFVGACVLLLGFFIRCLCSEHNKSSLMMAISVLGFLCLLIGVFYFPSRLTAAVKSDLGGKCPSSLASLLNGPCDTFWGTDTYTINLVIKMTIQRVWGPFVGWYCAVISIPIYLIVMYLSFKGKKVEASSLYQNLAGGQKDTQYL